MITPTETELGSWQTAVDLLANMLRVPAGLVMECGADKLTVRVSSSSPGNPFTVGDATEATENLYCDRVVSQRSRLHVNDARTSDAWNGSPDVELGFIAYLGYPLRLSDDEVFGTLCVLDNRPRTFIEAEEQLIIVVRDLIEGHLALLREQDELRNVRHILTEKICEVSTLEHFIPICYRCKQVRDNSGYWQSVEEYFRARTDADFSHGLCPDCLSQELEQSE